MANLLKIAESLDVTLDELNLDKIEGKERPSGYKRRTWLADTGEKDDNAADESTNLVREQGLSTGFINPVDKPDMSADLQDSSQGVVVSLSQLRGNPLKIAKYIFELSKHNDDRVTKELTPCELKKYLSISFESAKTGIKFLTKNNLVKRVEVKVGRFGWSKYRLCDKLYFEIKQDNERTDK